MGTGHMGDRVEGDFSFIAFNILFYFLKREVIPITNFKYKM